MAKKRKSVATRLDEVDRTMYSTFCSAANSLSQLYSQAMNQQKLSFQSGERHAMEKIYEWILRQQNEGSRPTTADVLGYLQNELDYSGEEPSMSPRPPSTHVSSGSFGPGAIGQIPRPGHPDHQAKNSVFSNALSSPVRRSLQNYHIEQGGGGGGGYYTNNPPPPGPRNNESNSQRETNSISSNDSSMDMHESPGHDSSY
ncbi:hypothetical protein GIB67_020475 [Kingdonia uniflora]|uniref:Holocarboxylase synthetase n=1 Tax=Kingdonia uniflora TaxID=39325 RepID=A0A7J7LUM3_9MAGN|nr:hypothetical protein GIB67_020475 [Kingdonia uniflora]